MAWQVLQILHAKFHQDWPTGSRDTASSFLAPKSKIEKFTEPKNDPQECSKSPEIKNVLRIHVKMNLFLFYEKKNLLGKIQTLFSKSGLFLISQIKASNIKDRRQWPFKWWLGRFCRFYTPNFIKIGTLVQELQHFQVAYLQRQKMVHFPTRGILILTFLKQFNVEDSKNMRTFQVELLFTYFRARATVPSVD